MGGIVAYVVDGGNKIYVPSGEWILTDSTRVIQIERIVPHEVVIDCISPSPPNDSGPAQVQG